MESVAEGLVSFVDLFLAKPLHHRLPDLCNVAGSFGAQWIVLLAVEADSEALFMWLVLLVCMLFLSFSLSLFLSCFNLAHSGLPGA